jgi:SAM-dependent methyltransferase
MQLLRTVKQEAWRIGAAGREVVNRGLTSVGVVESEEKLNRDAQEYWRATSGDLWKCHSHWRDASIFADGDLWSEVGRRHLRLFERMARMRDRPLPAGSVLEWGCGGGANAVHFAPLGCRFVGVEVSQESLDECARQLVEVSSPPFQPILIDVDDPEAVLRRLAEPVALFTSFCVFELITSQEYGARLLRIARDALADDGVAFIQIKYDTGSWWTRARRRGYRSGRLADMTTYRIDSFWSLARSCGLEPEAVHLVPQNELDKRYAYFLLSKPVRA